MWQYVEKCIRYPISCHKQSIVSQSVEWMSVPQWCFLVALISWHRFDHQIDGSLDRYRNEAMAVESFNVNLSTGERKT
jgi:hypothetical protein